MGSKSVTIGYRYSMGIHMGLCRGPVNAITKIMAAGKTVWTENDHSDIWYPPAFGLSVLPYPEGPIQLPYFLILKSSLFGGDKREGGISGSLYIMYGEKDQIIPDAVRSSLGNDNPEFRGITTLFFDGQIAAMNPYIKPWEIWAWRTTAGWENDDPWYPECATILLASESGGTIHAMNPAHIIYQCHTDHDWGGGQDRSTIDDEQMRAAADALYTENFGLCLDWVRQGTISEFIGTICEHIGASWRQNRLTGLFELKLARGDYDPDEIPVFNEDTGLLSIEEDESAAMAGAVNEVVVKWEEPLSGEARQNRERNLAAIAADGRLVSEVVEYPGLPTAALAGRIANRDLTMRSGGLKRFKLRLDRRAYKIQIGDVFRVASPARGIENIILRAGRVEDGTIDHGEISITAVQDIFGLPSTAISSVPPITWEPPDRAPRPVSTQRLVEATWRDLASWLDPANLELLTEDPTAAYLGLLAKQPTSLSINYNLQTRVGEGAWESHDIGDFADTGTLLLAIPIDPSETLISIQGVGEQANIAVGDALLLDDEICRIVEWSDMLSMAVITRGCVDTVPATHAAGTRAWLLDDATYPPTAWTAGASVQVRALTMTSEGVLNPDYATIDTITLAGRQGRPYPPGNFKINGQAYPDTVTNYLTVSWSHRDRVIQADQLIDTTEGDIGPEPGTTYNIDFYDENDNLAHTETGITDTSWTWDAEAVLWGDIALLHFDGDTDFTDEVGRIWTPQGSPVLSTEKSKFGSASLLLNGTNYISTPASSDFDFALINFTVEAFICRSSDAVRYSTILGSLLPTFTANARYLMVFGAAAGVVNTRQRLGFGGNDSTIGNPLLLSQSTLELNKWYHIAVTRKDNVFRMFIDGKLEAIATKNVTVDFSQNGTIIGSNGWNIADKNGFFTGFIDEMRVTKGIARYTDEFTPPTEPFTILPPGVLNKKVRIVLESERDGLKSVQAHDWTIRR